MSNVESNPQLQTNLTLEIGETTYSEHVSSVDFTPPAKVTWRGGTPGSKATATPDGWICNVTAIQDWQTENSLVNFLLDHDGETAKITYKPDTDGTFGLTADIVLTAPKIGGAVNVFLESVLAFDSTKPVRLVPTPQA